VLSELRSRGDIIDTATTVQLVVAAIVGGVALPRLKRHFTAPLADTAGDSVPGAAVAAASATAAAIKED
jgi:hypothetical protein